MSSERLDIATISFNVPWLVREQIRLFQKNLTDPHVLTVYDNSDDPSAAEEIRAICADAGTPYKRLNPPQRLHHYGLNLAARDMLAGNAPYFGWVDHDVFPSCETALIPLIEQVGFLAISQRHFSTNRLYPWPGWLFVSREWAQGKTFDFNGLRAKDKKDDGDTGSGLWPLFTEDEWDRLPRVTHGYQSIRPHDGYGTQSHSIERLGDFVHLTNGARWLLVPDAEGREEILKEIVAEL